MDDEEDRTVNRNCSVVLLIIFYYKLFPIYSNQTELYYIYTPYCIIL